MAELLARFTESPGHQFWPDDIRLLDRRKIDSSRLLHPNQVAYSYLLAVAHNGQLATLDRRFIPDAVIDGKQTLHVIP
jgi:hypothetical protein